MKTVLVSGASGDIGIACCEKFLNEGYNVVACYNSNFKPLESLTQKYTDNNLLVLKVDVTVKEEIENLFEKAQNTFGTIDALVCSAGISRHGLIQDVTEEELVQIVDVNIKGTFRLNAKAVEYMVKNQNGSIVNISSMWGDTGASCEVAYSMSKAAVVGLTKALAKEVGPCNIRVNCVSPGLIDTKMNSCYLKEELDAIAEETPLMRMGQCSEVAEAVFYLISDKSSFVTGQVLAVNGGYVI